MEIDYTDLDAEQQLQYLCNAVTDGIKAFFRDASAEVVCQNGVVLTTYNGQEIKIDKSNVFEVKFPVTTNYAHLMFYDRHKLVKCEVVNLKENTWKSVVDRVGAKIKHNSFTVFTSRHKRDYRFLF